jgi:glycerol-3-phosphate dehydrogenase
MGFNFPSYHGGGRPLWQLRIGVKLYDLLCSGRNFEPSRGFTPAETLQRIPKLNRDGLRGSVRYSDALTNDARLVVDTLRSAAAHDATLCNYVRFHDASRTGSVWSCEVEDVLTGEHFLVRARSIVNATGPWAQQVPHSSVKLRLSKGIHVVVDRQRLPIVEAVVITEGKRILFLIPWGERVIIGTTDTDYRDTPEKVQVEPADVAYVLRTVNDFFPELRLRENDIVSSWAGLRPLIANPDGSPSDISRAHQIVCPEPGWWDVAGGKLTTYRLMAEQTVDQLAKYLGAKPVACRTAVEPLLSPAQATSYSGTVPPPVSKAAVEHYVNAEWALHLDDVMMRRSSWHYYQADASHAAERVAGWMAELLCWTTTQQQRELARYDRAAGWSAPTKLAASA